MFLVNRRGFFVTTVPNKPCFWLAVPGCYLIHMEATGVYLVFHTLFLLLRLSFCSVKKKQNNFPTCHVLKLTLSLLKFQPWWGPGNVFFIILSWYMKLQRWSESVFSFSRDWGWRYNCSRGSHQSLCIISPIHHMIRYIFIFKFLFIFSVFIHFPLRSDNVFSFSLSSRIKTYTFIAEDTGV